jgi:hypothetical protein
VGVKAFFDMMHIGPHKVMLFGAACTQVTDPIAKASKRWHLTQVRHTTPPDILIEILALFMFSFYILGTVQKWSNM